MKTSKIGTLPTENIGESLASVVDELS